MFIDEAILTVKAGSGGKGAITFFPMRKGPSGGLGGNGGSIFVQGDRQMADLHNYKGLSVIRATNGASGQNFRKNGKHGDDIILKVPVGTLLTNDKTGATVDVTDDATVHLLARGGTGGKGNAAFATPTFQVPRISEPGTIGEKHVYRVVLRLIADFGLIGIPNAGKSSLLNELTAAKVRTAMYAFTTLEPNLGVFQDKVIADIPGLIEGASTGKGLGVKFLKHVEKVPILLHCIAADSTDIVKTYETVNHELGSYNPELLKKDHIILITKTDLVDSQKLKKIVQTMKKYQKEVWTVSIYNPQEFEDLQKKLLAFVPHPFSADSTLQTA
ncbi:Obg family GTPase CgtA [Candidatus Woesebacteria bacterium]|nr:Obg family GTPase CgtA [Candidatus Woesebacteria bacterium]